MTLAVMILVVMEAAILSLLLLSLKTDRSFLEIGVSVIFQVGLIDYLYENNMDPLKKDFQVMIANLGILKVACSSSTLNRILLIAENLWLIRYPIYRIPTGPTLKDLDACFLTFHFLSTLSGGVAKADPVITYPQGVNGIPKMPLPAFGLATYKFKNAMWSSSVGHDKQLASSLLQAAHDWLQRLRVNHRDYQFFVSHGAFRK